MSYTPRTTQPDSGDLRWTKQTYGGYNVCILGSPSAWTGSVLANCTGYVHGRWMEIGNTNTEYNLSTGNAREYYGYNDGYDRGQEPKQGAILCLSGGGSGHVAIVEEVLDNGDVYCSESNYGRKIFEYVLRRKANGYKRDGSTLGGFQGFIYHPNITTNYNVTCNNCTVSNSNPSAGEVITVYANIPSGYRFTGWIASGTTAPSGTPTQWTYTQPANDVTITAIIVKEYTVTCYNCQPSNRLPIAGEVVTITARTYKGYKLIKWIVNGTSAPVGAPKWWSYTQPANDVTITAVFKKDSIALYTARQVYKRGII